MNREKIITSLIALGYIIMITVNGMANALPINNKTTGELSDSIQNLFVPAGITFSIWGIIYLWLLIFVIYSMLASFRNNNDKVFIGRIGNLFFLNALANAGWIFAWHYELIGLSLILMLIILISLIAMYLRLEIGKNRHSGNEVFFVHMPISLYLGWITVATIANVTALLVTIHWQGLGLSEVTWTVIMIIIAVIITVLVLYQKKDTIYSLVVIWALSGIIIKRNASDIIYNEIISAAFFGIVVITVMLLINTVIRLKKSKTIS